MRFLPEEKLDIIQLARSSGLGFKKTLSLFGIKPHRVWQWIRSMEEQGFLGLIDKPPIPKTLPFKRTSEEESLILEKANAYTHLNHRNLSHQIFRDEGVFVSESLVYRILKEHHLIISKPALEIEAAASWKKQPQSPHEICILISPISPAGLIQKVKRYFTT